MFSSSPETKDSKTHNILILHLAIFWVNSRKQKRMEVMYCTTATHFSLCNQCTLKRFVEGEYKAQMAVRELFKLEVSIRARARNPNQSL